MKSDLNSLKLDVKAAFEAYLSATGTVRDRAKVSGEALIRLRAACGEQKLNFVGTLKELGVVVSTAYHHISYVECIDQAAELARTMGVEFDALGIAEVIGLVKPPKRKSAPKPTAGAGTNGAAGGVFAQAAPPAAPPLTAQVQKLIDRNLVLVKYAVRGHSVRVEVGDTPVLVVPR